MDYGTDIDDNWIFKDGDLTTVTGEDNLRQALKNRLLTPEGHFQWCYNDYGSDLHDVIGEYNTERLGDYVCVSIQYSLLADPRVSDIVEINHNRKGETLEVTVTVQLTNDETLTLNLVITENNKVNILGEEQ